MRLSDNFIYLILLLMQISQVLPRKRKVIPLQKWIQMQIVKAIRKNGIPISQQKVQFNIYDTIFENIFCRNVK